MSEDFLFVFVTPPHSPVGKGARFWGKKSIRNSANILILYFFSPDFHWLITSPLFQHWPPTAGCSAELKLCADILLIHYTGILTHRNFVHARVSSYIRYCFTACTSGFFFFLSLVFSTLVLRGDARKYLLDMVCLKLGYNYWSWTEKKYFVEVTLQEGLNLLSVYWGTEICSWNLRILSKGAHCTCKLLDISKIS